MMLSSVFLILYGYMRLPAPLVPVSLLSPVAHHLHAANHGANCEKAKHFSTHDAQGSELLSIDASNAAQG